MPGQVKQSQDDGQQAEGNGEGKGLTPTHVIHQVPPNHRSYRQRHAQEGGIDGAGKPSLLGLEGLVEHAQCHGADHAGHGPLETARHDHHHAALGETPQQGGGDEGHQDGQIDPARAEAGNAPGGRQQGARGGGQETRG